MNRYLAKLASLDEKRAYPSNPQNPQNRDVLIVKSDPQEPFVVVDPQ